ncbi:winged helix-turn-helix transcriptional regulator [Amycolatopsis sp. NPDC098790]|uniref:winged helix-turn-helix transcriptional regulator n=1 Tax=Amycolatopsis sp. NPDC098790 TaxID=3363939 RepID=UPI003807CB7D
MATRGVGPAHPGSAVRRDAVGEQLDPARPQHLVAPEGRAAQFAFQVDRRAGRWRPRVAYRFTPTGERLRPVLEVMADWALTVTDQQPAHTP